MASSYLPDRLECLLAGIVRQARRDYQDGDVSAGEFLRTLGVNMSKLQEQAQAKLAEHKQAETAEADRISKAVTAAAAKLAAQREVTEELTQQANAAELARHQAAHEETVKTRALADWIAAGGTKREFDIAWTKTQAQLRTDKLQQSVERRQAALQAKQKIRL